MITTTDFLLCALCPRLCRHVCPVAVGSSREVATPTSMMLGPYRFAKDQVDAADALEVASLCTGCNRCTESCLYERPVADLLQSARGELGDPVVTEPLPPLEGEGELVAIECDDRRWRGALAAYLQVSVSAMVTADHLGEALLDHPEAFEAHAESLSALLGERTAVVGCHGCGRVLQDAGVAVRHLAGIVAPEGGDTIHHPCQGPRLEGETPKDALACCGAAHPLASAHPTISAEVSADAARRLGHGTVRTTDTRCACALRQAGAKVRDPVDALLGAMT